MIHYRFHWSLKDRTGDITPTLTVEAESRLHGAAQALREFSQLGCDLAAPLAHLDIRDSDGAPHTLLIEEVLDWLRDPEQRDFMQREGLGPLLQ